MSNYDSFEAGILIEGMTSEQKLQFHQEMSDAWRDPKKAARLKMWLGGIGAHHFYLGDQSRGRKSRLFFWTGIPVIMTMFEGDIKKRTQRVNSDLAKRIAASIKGGESIEAPGPLRENHTQTFAAAAATGERRSKTGKWVLIGIGLIVAVSLVAVVSRTSAGSNNENKAAAVESQNSPSQPEVDVAKTSPVAASVLPTPTPSDASVGLQDLVRCAHDKLDDDCLKNPALQQRLNVVLATLSKDRREMDFDYSLIVNREDFVDGDVVTLSGSQPHAAPYAGAAISVDVNTGLVLVGIHAADKLTVYGAAEKTLGALPSRMQQWIRSREENMKPQQVAVGFR